MNTIGLLCAVETERLDIDAPLKRKRASRAGNVDFISGWIEDKKIVLALSGIGKVNASHGATMLLEKYKPSCIINYGIAGCYPDRGLSVGDAAVALREIYADEGVCMNKGFSDMNEVGIPLVRSAGKEIFNVFPADAALVRKFRKIEKRVPVNIKYGNFLTVSSVSGAAKRGKLLRDRFDGLCENMEGAAVFHIAYLYGVPCFEIRGVSNIVEDRDKDRWNIEIAAHNCRIAVGEFLKIV